jgi:hypothetical protein
MVTYFIGGSLGTLFATQVWKKYQWNGVCFVGIVISVLLLVIHLANHQKTGNNSPQST